MKIVFLNDLIYAYAAGVPSAVGGAERQQWLLARALASAGWQVTVGVRQPLGYQQRARVEQVEFVGIGQEHFLRAWCRFLKTEQPEWWYWRCASHLLGLAACLARLAGVRMMFAAAFDTDVNVRRALHTRKRLWPLYALGLSWSDRILVQSDKQMLALPKRWRAKAFKVPSITPGPAALRAHAERAPYVAWIAMLRKFKRPDLLVEIAGNAPDVKFVVCGGPTTFTAEPGYGERITTALRSLANVEYRGQVAPEEAVEAMNKAAVFLSTSDEEGFPNTFLQAWSAGTPVVSLKIDPDGVIARHGLGRVSSSPDQAIEDLRSLLRSIDERDAIARRARRYIARDHSAAAAVRTLEAAIGKTMATRPMETRSATLA
jgi:glycosyltransferase involved in cell wall biosynthesis